MSLSRIDLIFDRLPGAYLVLLPNPPYFTIVGFNQARSKVTNSFGREVLGKDLFEVFPDNPDDPNASGVKNLGASLLKVLESGLTHKMPVQKYDILVDGVFEERYWHPENIPVFDEEGKLVYIIHSLTALTCWRDRDPRAVMGQASTTIGRKASTLAIPNFGMFLIACGLQYQIFSINNIQGFSDWCTYEKC